MRRRKIFIGSLIAAILSAIIFLALPMPWAFYNPISDSLRILDRNGRLLYELRSPQEGLKQHTPLGRIPASVTEALIAVEDHTFHTHAGVSLRGTARAFIQNIRSGKVVSGGSTITQQLVRNVLRPKHRGVAYKAYEALLALKLETRISKEDILERYLNTAYFGHRAYGISAASKTYFGKDPALLSLGESALLAGVLQSPVNLDPFTNAKGALARRKTVLEALERTGRISPAQSEDAKNEPLLLASDRIDIKAPHFVMWLVNSRPESFEGTKEVRTTLDLELQNEIEAIVENKLAMLINKNVTSAAVVVLDAQEGDVLAMVGSADYFDTAHDGAVNVALASRQPGSAVKPFTYALAFSKGWTAATTVADIETQFLTGEGNPYIPRNYDYGYHGLVRLREALANSYNIAAIRVAEFVGVPALMDFMRAAGIGTLDNSPEHYGLALTLGNAEVRLLELAQAFGIFARLGTTLTPRVLLSDPVEPGKQIISKQVAWLVTDILADDSARIAEFGRGGPLSFDFPVPAKTGTTRNSRDNWTVGYTPERIVGVWVGNADNTPMRGTSGITGAAPIFHDVMLAASTGLQRSDFSVPEGMIEMEVCKLSGKLKTPECPHTVAEIFIDGTQPKEPDDIFRKIEIDSRNGLKAGSGCTNEFRKPTVFAVFPPQLRKWARENGWPSPPDTYSPLCTGNNNADESVGNTVTITRPADGDVFLRDPMVPDADEKIFFEARAGDGVRQLTWYVNGIEAGIGVAPDFRLGWIPEITGSFQIEARSPVSSDEIRINVEK